MAVSITTVIHVHPSGTALFLEYEAEGGVLGVATAIATRETI